jgi:hypothetical protein
MQKRFVKKRDYDKIAVMIQRVGEEVTYTGSYEDLEFEGATKGDVSDVREVLARMLAARKDIPERLMSLVSSLTGYIELMVNAGVKHVTASYGYEFKWSCEVGARVSALYDIRGGSGDNQYAGWIITMRAYFEGYDGLTLRASHDVKKKLRPGDTLDIDALRAELAWLVKMAYNAYKGGPYRECV